MTSQNLSNAEKARGILAYIRGNPQLQSQLEQYVKSSEDSKNIEQQLVLGAKWFWYLFNAHPDAFNGTAFVSQELRQHSILTAKVASASSLIDFLSNWPILFFLFAALGQGPALIISFGLNLWLLQVCNYTASATSGRKLNNRSWSHWATVSLILLNILQTLASGVGIELLNNQTTLSQLRAAELKQEGEQRVEELQNLTSPRLVELDQRCEAGKKQMLSLKAAGDPAFNTIYVKLYGPYGERDRDWSQTPVESRPTCVQRDFLEQEAFQNYERAKQNWEQLLADSILLDDVTFIKNELPELYTQHFDDEGLLRSGVDAARLAMQNFFGKMLNLQFMDLGLSLYVFGISAITSLAACAMAISHASREDTQMSRDENIIRERDRYLQQIAESLEEA